MPEQSSLLARAARALLRPTLKPLPGVSADSLDLTHGVLACNHATPWDAALILWALPAAPTTIVHAPERPPSARLKQLCHPTRWSALEDAAPESARAPLAQALNAGERIIWLTSNQPQPDNALTDLPGWLPALLAACDAPLIPLYLRGARLHRMVSPWGLTGATLRAPIELLADTPITSSQWAPNAPDAPIDPALRLLQRLAARRLQGELAGRADLWTEICLAARRFGRNRIAVEDATGAQASYGQLILRALVLEQLLRPHARKGDAVGVLLPGSVGCVTVLLALQAGARVPAMLNFSAGPHAMAAACRTADIGLILTSRLFLAKAGLQEAATQLTENARVLYLEDLRPAATLAVKLNGLRRARRPLAAGAKPDPHQPALILFTSGSEGASKGVMLSHQNLLANIAQMRVATDVGFGDRYLNALPLFHSFGLTVGTLKPLLSGLRLFLCPNPLEYRRISEIARHWRPTVMAGADTFLFGYARAARTGDFHTVRYLFAGAEPLREATRLLWFEKFGVRVLQGYGATEAAPAVAVNLPHADRPASVGRPLPGIETRLEPVTGWPPEQGGRLWIRGPNVMLGYLLPQEYKPGQAPQCRPPQAPWGAGWYDTGDLAHIDDAGFVTLRGRLKRFAKIGGEMVSLEISEAVARTLWPDHAHGVIRAPGDKRGERLILLTTRPDADAVALFAALREAGHGEIYAPKRIIHIDAMPLLGSGKVDYPALEEIAAKALSES
ncbi:AMP-binding protein [Magnetofaba australis]|uniref:Putative AMP-dependent synthetase and ligase n=1 Tax=Magnetofaba australis IT-1 TaxID=1434232 RepID=A0A1Y2K2L9_9PROT|nr:AMP-binding protein [Magnetofaba australis]OSM02280.1 putative AMP-dependent synthetase and ligase [Magnetofaba australis IT-1]